MNPDPLEDLLREHVRRPLPPAGSQTKAAIWARIDAQKRRTNWLGLRAIFSWRDLFAEPRIAIAGLVVALLAGVVPVAAAAGSLDTTQKARASLHLQCFAHCPSCLAGTMRPEDMRP